MEILVLLVMVMKFYALVLCNDKMNSSSTNSTDQKKDMYVIHAMVYQVGILTNKTDEKTKNETLGNQEALTFYRTNGSKLDLSDIPAPLLTNVTAQSMIQLAPKTAIADHQDKLQISWSDLKNLAALPQNSSNTGNPRNSKIVRHGSFGNQRDNTYFEEAPQTEADDNSYQSAFKDLFKRELSDNRTTVKVVKGSAMIPPSAGVQSIAIPPLLTLNKNLSDIPVPIPNTSVVHYAKINTLIRKP